MKIHKFFLERTRHKPFNKLSFRSYFDIINDRKNGQPGQSNNQEIIIFHQLTHILKNNVNKHIDF